VLVNGAAGGIGAFGVQLARHSGAVVTGVARLEKHDFVRGLGAGQVLEPGALLDSGQTWDVMFDTPPALDFARLGGVLAPDGVYVSTRPFPTSLAALRGAVGKSGPRFGGVQTRERAVDLAFLARLIDTGALRVPLDRTFPLEEIRQAHEYAESRAVRGKVVVTVASGVG